MVKTAGNRASAANLGGLLRGLRHQAGLTLRQVDAMAQGHPEPVAYDYLSRVEGGHLLPTAEKLLTLSHVYEVPAYHFIDVLELGQYERLAPRSDDPEELQRAGQDAAQAGDFPRAYAAFLRGLDLLKTNPSFDRPTREMRQARMRISLAIALTRLGKSRMAEQQIFQVLEAHQLPPGLAARALNMLSHLEYQLDRLQLAGAAAVLARRAAGAAGDTAQKAQALVNLANVKFDQKNFPGALGLYRRAIAAQLRPIAERAPDLAGLAEHPEGAANPDRALVLINIGNCHHELGDFGEAGRAFGESVHLAEASPDRRTEAAARTALGRSLFRRGEMSEARTVLLAAHALAMDHVLHPEAFHSAFYLWRIAVTWGVGAESAALLRDLKRLRLRVGQRSEEVGSFDDYLGESRPRRRRKGVPHVTASELFPPLSRPDTRGDAG